MSRLVLLVALLGMINYSYTYWLPWKNDNAGQQTDTEYESAECSGDITDVECRVAYTKQPWSNISGLQFAPGYACSMENGLECLSGPLPGGHCPDFEIRFFCSELSGRPINHWTLTNGPRWSIPGLTAEQYCQSLTLDPSDYNVVENKGTYSLIPAPDVLNYACTMSTGNGAYIDLGNHSHSCVSDPSKCSSGESTWSIWLKINHTENVAPVTFMSSGTENTTGVYFSRLTANEFKFGAAVSSEYWYTIVSSSLIPNGSWFHLAILIETNLKTLSVYINGIEKTGISIQVTTRTSTAMPSDGSLTLGTISGQEGQQVATSAYSDFMIFDRKLSEDKISNINNCGTFDGDSVVWNIQQLEVSNPNELKYQCIYTALFNIGSEGFKWLLYLNNEGVLTREELKQDTSPYTDTCFYKSELVINKTRLVRDEYVGTQMFIVCEVVQWKQYESLEIEAPQLTTELPTTSQSTTLSQTTAHQTDQSSTAYATSIGQSATVNERTSSMTTPEPITFEEGTTSSQVGVMTSTSDQSATAYATSTGQSTFLYEITSSSMTTPEPITIEDVTPATQAEMTATGTEVYIMTSEGQSSAVTLEPVVQSSSPQAATDGTGPLTSSSSTQNPESLTTEIVFTSDASMVFVTPTWCALADVVDLQTAITCGDASRIDVEPGKLTDAKKDELLNFLKFIASQPVEQLTTLSETAAVTQVVLMAFTKLTDPDQSLSLQEEAEILADTEEALEVLAGTLLPNTCSSLGYESSNVNLCNSPSVGILNGYLFTNEVPLSYNDAGEVTESFEETLEFDLSGLDLDAEDVNVVVLRKENAAVLIDKVKYLEQTDNLRSPNETWIQLNSAFWTFSLFVQGNRTSVPVTFRLYHLKDVNDESQQGDGATVNITRNAICAFVDDEDDQDAQWSAWGCEVVQDRSTSRYSHCACNHSTNFAVLMQVKSYEISPADSLALMWITYIGCGTSMVMLVLTLAVFFYLGRLLRSDRSFIHSNLSVAILAAQILFIAGIDRTENRGVCKAVALLLHFCYLSVFAWMLVEGVHLYIKIIKVYGSENIKMYPYLFIGWGIPVIITLISFGASHDGYGTGNSCWLDTSSGLIWAFVAPALLVIVINMIVLAMVVHIVIKSAHLRQEKKYDHIKAGIKGAIMLLPILGLTWVFGLLAVNSATIVFQYLFTIFNSFQGLFIFLINCVFNSEVRAAFVRKREKQKMAHDRETMAHSLTFMYTTKKTSEAENTADTRGRCSYDRKQEYTDVTSLRSGSPSSQPGSSSSLHDVAQPNHMKRPHSGKVSPMPMIDEPDELDYI